MGAGQQSVQGAAKTQQAAKPAQQQPGDVPQTAQGEAASSEKKRRRHRPHRRKPKNPGGGQAQ